MYTLNAGESYTDLEVIPGEGGNPASVKIIGELDDSAAEWKVISCRPSCTATSKNRRARISSEWFVATFDGPAQVPKNFKNRKFGTYASFWAIDKQGNRLLVKLWHYDMEAYEVLMKRLETTKKMLLMNVKYTPPQGTFGAALSITRVNKSQSQYGLVLPVTGCLKDALSLPEDPKAKKCISMAPAALEEAWGAAKAYDEGDLNGSFHTELEAIIVAVVSLGPLNAEVCVIPSSAPRSHRCAERLLIPAKSYDTVFGFSLNDDRQHRPPNVTKALSHAKNQGAFKFLLESRTKHVLDVATSSSGD